MTSKGKGKGQSAELKEQLLQHILAHPNHRDKGNRKGKLPQWVGALTEKSEFKAHLKTLHNENANLHTPVSACVVCEAR